MIFFDLDGVLRDLCGAAKVNPKSWNELIHGEDFVEYFTKRAYLLFTAQPTEYTEVAQICRKYLEGNFMLLTTQPHDWRSLTEEWVRMHFPDWQIVYSEDKLSFLNQGDILIEDSPNLSNYSQVLLIDRPYNQCIDLPHTRVYTPKGLFKKLIERIYK